MTLIEVQTPEIFTVFPVPSTTTSPPEQCNSAVTISPVTVWVVPLDTCSAAGPAVGMMTSGSGLELAAAEAGGVGSTGPDESSWGEGLTGASAAAAPSGAPPAPHAERATAAPALARTNGKASKILR